ncbi:hypothetical protein GS886_26340 [Rhodococcus hoagii]|nr:hypothetical protein [Prescottella equi]
MDDLAAFMDPTLRLPIGGRDYTIECSAWQGLHLHRLFSEPGRILDDNAERAEILQMLGDTYQQMVDDGLSWPKIAVAGRTALFWFGISPEAAAATRLGSSAVSRREIRYPRRRARRRRGRS